MTAPNALDLRTSPEISAKQYRVFVNGDMYRGVVAWNVAEGWIEALQRDDDGNVVPHKGDFLTMRIWGVVKVYEV